MTTISLREDVHTSTSRMRVDREKGVVYGVKVLGERSANGRRYARTGIQKAVGLYEGSKVNLNHPVKSGDVRVVQDRFGKLQNVRYAEDGSLYGDLHYLKSHPAAPVITEAAERMPDCFGCSHNATGRSVPRNGENVVEEILSVTSVDLVSDPATTAGLFEAVKAKTGETWDAAEELSIQQEARELSTDLNHVITNLRHGGGSNLGDIHVLERVSGFLDKISGAVDVAIAQEQLVGWLRNPDRRSDVPPSHHVTPPANHDVAPNDNVALAEWLRR